MMRGIARGIVGVALPFLLASCGLLYLLGLGRTPIDNAAMYAKILAAGPVLNLPASERSLLVNARAVSLDDNLNAIYAALKDYDPTIDTGSQDIDGSNIYVAASSAADELHRGSTDASDRQFGSPASVTPTKDLGLPALTFTNGGTSTGTGTASGTTGTYARSWAYSVAATTVEGLVAVTITAADSVGTNLYYTKTDSGSNSVDVRLVYNGTRKAGPLAGNIYAPRVELIGNSATHHFRIRGLLYGLRKEAPDFEYLSTYEAAGTARGAGQYMIFHVKRQTNLGGAGWVTTQEGWYKVPVGASDVELSALVAQTSLDGLAASDGDPSNYGAEVPTNAFALSDAATTAASFAGGNALALP